MIAAHNRHWSTPTDRINSFCKVGINQDGLAPENVDRSKFVMAPPPSVRKTKKITTVVESPAGVEKGSLEYYQKKFEAAQGIIEEQAQRAVDPKEAGILVVREPEVNRNMSRMRIIDGHGSVVLSDLLGKRKAQEAAREKEASAKRKRADDRAHKKAEKDAAFKASLAFYERCKDIGTDLGLYPDPDK